MKLYLQNITENYSINNLPQEWLHFDWENFSTNKKLYPYQQKALENALKALCLYFEEDKAEKKQFFQRFVHNGLTEELGFHTKKESKTIQYLLEYDKDFPIDNDKISFEHLISRMSFWMATGSGKTLVIVKLLELLAYLIQNKKIPQKDILFLTYRDDLLEQFKNHVAEFNRSNNIHIRLINLKEYSSIKRAPALNLRESMNVYFYRSDLISDEQKDKILDFKNYDNNGNWYILLDEAHKGDREDSKRQTFYNILSRNGFLFNFSATFTDPRDFATCVFNFNLSRFIEDGYGKHIYISQENISVLEKQDKLIEAEKQKIILKIFVLQTAIHKFYQTIKGVSNNLYHKPLLLTLVNSVNTNDSDLELFFREIEKIATNNNRNEALLKEAIDELKTELSSQNAKFIFEETHINSNIINMIDTINYVDILEAVFNATTNGKIEIIKIPGNKQELIFKLTTSSRPFALMKIGDISEWIKNKLSGYEIVEKFENESIFKAINNSEDINILMGSRSFYEGWDSNRPNIILFINIGKGTDAQKFVLQAIGRGIRIEPIKNKRKRAWYLYNNKEINESIFTQIKDILEPLETLFVYGTKAENLKEVVETLKQEKPDVLLGDLFEINPDVKDKLLLIPVYKDTDQIIVEEENMVKFPIHSKDYDSTKAYFNYLEDKICLIKYNCNIKVLNKLKDAFNGKKNNYFIESEERQINHPEFLLGRIFKHFERKAKEFDTFKKLEEEVIHFKRIHVSIDKLNHLREKIEKVKQSKSKEEIEKKIDREFDEGKISKDEYKVKIKEIENSIVKEAETTYSLEERIKIKYLANHYYLPVALSDAERADFIQHIIKHKSEVDFINDLEKYLQQENNFFKNFDWWYFSKIDETLDEVYIPYYNPKTNRIDKFKPDFIFWLKKDNSYQILFIDPKGTEHTDGYRKIDGYSKVFEKNQSVLTYNSSNVYVRLLLKTNDIAKVQNNYKNYWFDHFDSIKDKLKIA
ncbi:MAG: DEAD/DEAH box helicase family protein [Bacteroidia bacterium]